MSEKVREGPSKLLFLITYIFMIEGKATSHTIERVLTLSPLTEVFIQAVHWSQSATSYYISFNFTFAENLRTFLLTHDVGNYPSPSLLKAQPEYNNSFYRKLLDSNYAVLCASPTNQLQRLLDCYALQHANIVI